MYPPLDVLKPVGPDIWIVDGSPLAYLGISLPIRMTVVRLRSGELWLHSPTGLTPTLKAALDELGPVGHIVAPSTAHWMKVWEWQQACPHAVTWAAPLLAARKQVRASGTRFDRELGDAAPPEWSEVIAQAVLPGGIGYREMLFFHRASRTLLLTDLIVNLEADRLTVLTWLLARLTGTLAPRGKAPVYLRQIVRMQKRQAAAAMSRMVALEPERVIFSHGRWYDGNATPQLRAAMRWLLA